MTKNIKHNSQIRICHLWWLLKTITIANNIITENIVRITYICKNDDHHADDEHQHDGKILFSKI